MRRFDPSQGIAMLFTSTSRSPDHHHWHTDPPPRLTLHPEDLENYNHTLALLQQHQLEFTPVADSQAHFLGLISRSSLLSMTSPIRALNVQKRRTTRSNWLYLGKNLFEEIAIKMSS